MRQEINSLKDGLSGEIRIAAIPTVLGMVASLTTPFRARHPNVRFRIVSCTSIEVLGLLENLEVDAGLTYLDNEPLGKVRSVPLYDESYRLITAPDSQFGDRDQVTWKEVGEVPLCLLTPDMQNRRIIDRALLEAGTRGEAEPDVEFDHRALHPCEDRPLGQRDAGQARRYAGPVGCRAGDPDRRSRGDLPDRAGGSAARSDDADGRGLGSDRARGRADAGRLNAVSLHVHFEFVSIDCDS